MAVIQTPALILRHTTDREHDRVLTILTPSIGQLRVRARGTKKSVSKLGGSLEPMTEVHLTLADGRVTDIVTGSIILDRYPGLRKDIVSMTMAQWFLELVESVTKPDQPAEQLYQMVKSTLSSMEREQELSTGQRWSLLCRRALEILIHEGFAPTMDICSVCQRTLGDEDVMYHPQHGFTHLAEAHDGALKLRSATVAFLRTGVESVHQRTIWQEAHGLIELLVHHTLDRPLKSERVLRTVIRTIKLPKTFEAR